MSRVQWIKHRNKDIVEISYAGIKKEEDFIKAVEQATNDFVMEAKNKNAPQNSILLLVDVTDSVVGTGAAGAFKASAKTARPYVKKLAVVGIVGIKKALLDAILRFTDLAGKPFTEMSQARDWLTE